MFYYGVLKKVDAKISDGKMMIIDTSMHCLYFFTLLCKNEI